MKILPVLPLIAIAACSDDRPPAPTEEQSGQLNETEDMLNELGSQSAPPAEAPESSNRSD